jgi:hypothetical protein
MTNINVANFSLIDAIAGFRYSEAVTAELLSFRPGDDGPASLPLA